MSVTIMLRPRKLYFEQEWNFEDHFEFRGTEYSHCKKCGCLETNHHPTITGPVDPLNGMSFAKSTCNCGNCEYWIFNTRLPIVYIWLNPSVDPIPLNDATIRRTVNNGTYVPNPKESVQQAPIPQETQETLATLRSTRILTDALEALKAQTQTIEELKALVRILRKGACDPDAPCDRIEDGEPGTYVCGYHE